MSGTRRAPRLRPARAREWRRRWDRQQERYLPDREERFRAILDVLGIGLPARFRFLDLGAGCGSLSERVLREYPLARGVAVDFDPILLALGRLGLGTVEGRLVWHEADLRARAWSRGLPGRRFDAAVSTTALHWLAPAPLARLYATLAGRLRPGALFVNGDTLGFRPEAERLRRLARRAHWEVAPAGPSGGESWRRWWTEVQKEPGLRAEVELRADRVPPHHERVPPLDLEGHRRALARAGFRESEVVWSHWQNRVLVAVR